MANIKSSKKRIKVSKRQTMENQRVRSAMRTQLGKFYAAVENKDKALAEELYNATVSAVDGSVKTNIVHKNKANRTKARMAKMMTALAE